MYEKNGGATRDRTADPLLAKQVLSQLSYSPIFGMCIVLEIFYICIVIKKRGAQCHPFYLLGDI